MASDSPPGAGPSLAPASKAASRITADPGRIRLKALFRRDERLCGCRQLPMIPSTAYPLPEFDGAAVIRVGAVAVTVLPRRIPKSV